MTILAALDRTALKTAGGTPGKEPTFTVTTGTGVTFTGDASDTGVDAYEIDLA